MRSVSTTPGRNIARVALGGLFVLLAIPAARPATGPAVHVVRLAANRFDPAVVRAAPGDTVRFVNGQGGPHNVQFMPESTSVAAQEILNRAMTGRIAPLSGPLLILTDEAYDFVVPELPSGRYPFLCTPHWANMRGALIVAPAQVRK